MWSDSRGIIGQTMLRPVAGAGKGIRVDADGTLHLPVGCNLLTHLYANHGVRVRMVRRPPPKREKISSVRQLIDDLSRKHEHILCPDIEQDSKSEREDKQNAQDRSKSMSTFPDYVARFRSKMVEIRSSFRKTARMGLYNDYWIPPQFPVSSSSTPTVPFSSSELLYGNEEGVGSSHAGGETHGRTDEGGNGEVGAWDPANGDKHKVKELDLHSNKRPVSRGSTNKKIPTFERVSFDRDREELRPIANALPTSKQPQLRTNGIKYNLLRSDQYLCHRTNGATGREEDLVAMGTLWSPGQLQTRGSSTATTSSSKSTSNSGSGTGTFQPPAAQPVRRPVNLPSTNPSRPHVHQSTNSSLANPSMGNVIKSTKEVEPKYNDPLSGAAPSFQQRLMELAALEAETVRWERSKKVKKKPVKDS